MLRQHHHIARGHEAVEGDRRDDGPDGGGANAPRRDHDQGDAGEDGRAHPGVRSRPQCRRAGRDGEQHDDHTNEHGRRSPETASRDVEPAAREKRQRERRDRHHALRESEEADPGKRGERPGEDRRSDGEARSNERHDGGGDDPSMPAHRREAEADEAQGRADGGGDRPELADRRLRHAGSRQRHRVPTPRRRHDFERGQELNRGQAGGRRGGRERGDGGATAPLGVEAWPDDPGRHRGEREEVAFVTGMLRDAGQELQRERRPQNGSAPGARGPDGQPRRENTRRVPTPPRPDTMAT